MGIRKCCCSYVAIRLRVLWEEPRGGRFVIGGASQVVVGSEGEARGTFVRREPHDR